MILIGRVDDIAADHRRAFRQRGEIGVEAGVVAVHHAGLAVAEHGAGGRFFHGQIVDGDQALVVQLLEEGQHVFVFRFARAVVPLAVSLILGGAHKAESGGQFAVLDALAQVSLALEDKGRFHAVFLHRNQRVIELVDGLRYFTTDGLENILTIEQAAPVAVRRILFEDMAGHVIHFAVQLFNFSHVNGFVDVRPVIGSILLEHGGINFLHHVVRDQPSDAAIIIGARIKHDHIGQRRGAVECQYERSPISKLFQFDSDTGLFTPRLESRRIHGGCVTAVNNAAIQHSPEGQSRRSLDGISHLRHCGAGGEHHAQCQKECQNLFHV